MVVVVDETLAFISRLGRLVFETWMSDLPSNRAVISWAVNYLFADTMVSKSMSFCCKVRLIANRPTKNFIIEVF